MDEKEIAKIIEMGETHTVEFKESLSLKDEIGEEISALSNACGGLIFVGVADDGKTIGVQIGKKTVEDLANYIKIHTDNHIFPKITVEEIDGKNVITIEVNENHEKPVFFKGKAYGRIGKSTHKLSASEIRKLAKESGKKSYWDEQICKDASISDINEEKVKWFLKKAKYERNISVEPETSVSESLEKLELSKDGKITNAAVLLFGKNPQKFFLQSETRCAKFKGAEAVKPFLDMKVIGGTIYEQVDEAEKFVMNNIKKAAWIEPGKIERQEKWEYPLDAVREAITNAVCHREYDSSSNVQIRIFDDHLEIWNPGRLPNGWTVETLKKKHGSKPYNPLIAKLFFLVKYIEEWGTGTTNIVKDTIKHGLPEPLFEEIVGSIVITFRKYQITEEILEGLTERQKKAIDFLKEHKKITVMEYKAILKNITEKTAYRDLKNMEEKSIIKSIGEKKGRHYVLA